MDPQSIDDFLMGRLATCTTLIPRSNKHRVFIALHSRSLPAEQREKLGAAFYFWDIMIEPKNATQSTTIWNAWCAPGATPIPWRSWGEDSNLALHTSLVVKVMIGKVRTDDITRSAVRGVILNAGKPIEVGEDSSLWVRNVVKAMRAIRFIKIKKTKIDDLLEFCLKTADERVVDAKLWGGKVNYVNKCKFP